MLPDAVQLADAVMLPNAVMLPQCRAPTPSTTTVLLCRVSLTLPEFCSLYVNDTLEPARTGPQVDQSQQGKILNTGPIHLQLSDNCRCLFVCTAWPVAFIYNIDPAPASSHIETKPYMYGLSVPPGTHLLGQQALDLQLPPHASARQQSTAPQQTHST